MLLLYSIRWTFAANIRLAINSYKYSYRCVRHTYLGQSRGFATLNIPLYRIFFHKKAFTEAFQVQHKAVLIC